MRGLVCTRKADDPGNGFGFGGKPVDYSTFAFIAEAEPQDDLVSHSIGSGSLLAGGWAASTATGVTVFVL